MRIALAILSTLAVAVFSDAATVRYAGGNVAYSEQTPWGHIEIDFSPCMANRLYTFSSVRLDSICINRTDSDNIGPFLIAGKGWSGGNHLNDGRRSAETFSVTVYADSSQIDSDTVVTCRTLRVEVANNLYDPETDSLFCIEKIAYTVAGNSVDVVANHIFCNFMPETIDRYYGMQSMMAGEIEILTPGGKYHVWTPIGEVDRFTKASARSFCTFVEHSPHGYQASCMSGDGIGDRSMVDDDDVVFIGNSWNKSYHKLIGHRTVKAGDTMTWHGIYTWFREPVSDRCRPDDAPCLTFDYAASGPSGEVVLYHLHPDGSMTISEH